MPAQVRLGDNCTGHPKGPGPRPSAAGSPNHFVNGKPVIRVGDPWSAHPGKTTHVGSPTAEGSPNAFSGGQARMRIGDAIQCGTKAAEGSDNCIVN